MSDKTDTLIITMQDSFIRHGMDDDIDSSNAYFHEATEARIALLGEIATIEAERNALRARVAELEAAQRPVAFSEREPEEGQRILLWLNDRFSPLWGYTVSTWDATTLKRPRPAGEYWLPMPPAPAAQPPEAHA